MRELSEEKKKEIDCLKRIVDHFEKEDEDIRERQIRTWRSLKLMWDGFSNIWYDEVAHDWRIWSGEGDDSQDYYNKPVNIFRAYLESIIAALSITVPPIKCYPDDADNSLDLLTAKAGDKIAQLISTHNDAPLLWLHALYVLATEGMIACYNYTDEDEKYGTYEEKNFEEKDEEHEFKICSECNYQINETDEFDPLPLEAPDDPNLEFKEECPNCGREITPSISRDTVKVTRLIGTTTKPKSRQCMEIYGGLYVKIPNYAKRQKDIPYLMFNYETNYVFARRRYPEIRELINPKGNYDKFNSAGRTNPQYQGEEPKNNVTCRNIWLRSEAFEILNEDDEKEYDKLIKKYPNGCKVVFIDETFAEAVPESLDDHWTLSENPLSDHLHFDPLGMSLISIQEVMNDLISLIIQTIEHGIPQTFVDPSVVNLKAYRKLEATPGGLFAATPKSGKSVGDAFHEVRTASLSAEVLPFLAKVQELGQLVSGALPSLFGGQLTGGSGTASEYSMSRAQALQRLQTSWKMLTVFWKTIFSKVIPAYIKNVKDDDKIVQKDEFGNFVNVLLKKAELEGKIGNIELESNENLPMTWNQRRDVIMKILDGQNPQLLAMINQPENIPLLYETIGIPDFYIPGEDDRNKQYDEIKELLNSEPITQPPDEMAMIEAATNGMPPPMETEIPSVEVDQEMDNHAIEFEICRKWAVSEVGRQAKIDNQSGYKNVLLHAALHKNMITQSQSQIPPQGDQGKPTSPGQIPIGEQNVEAQV